MEGVLAQDLRRKPRLQICCLVALWAEVFGTWAINTFLYPLYLGILPEARDLASLVGVVTLCLFAVWARRRPSSLNAEHLSIGSLCIYVLGIAFILLGLWESSAAYLAIGSMLRSIGSRWFLILMGITFCQLSGRACMLCIAGAYALNYAVRPLLLLCSATFPLVVVFACPLIVLIAIYPFGREMVKFAQSSEPPINASVTEPASFISLFSVFYLAIFFFRIAYGFALSFETVDGVPQQTLLSALPILLVLALTWKPRLPKADVLYMASCLLIIAGFLLVLIFRSAAGASFAVFANGFLFVGSECFEMLMLFTLAAIGARNKANAISVFAWGRAASSFGLLTGVTVGHVMADLPSVIAGTAIVAAIFFLFVAFNLTVLKGFSFQDTIDGVRPLPAGDPNKGVNALSDEAQAFEKNMNPSSAEAHKGDLSGEVEAVSPVSVSAAGVNPLTLRVGQIACDRGLTPRETEIMTLLAQGRNSAFLQEKLVLSRNTIKTHVSNIYAKLGIHSQQELIDLVESYETTL